MQDMNYFQLVSFRSIEDQVITNSRTSKPYRQIIALSSTIRHRAQLTAAMLQAMNKFQGCIRIVHSSVIVNILKVSKRLVRKKTAVSQVFFLPSSCVSFP
jgi:hypothetical protein